MATCTQQGTCWNKYQQVRLKQHPFDFDRSRYKAQQPWWCKVHEMDVCWMRLLERPWRRGPRSVHSVHMLHWQINQTAYHRRAGAFQGFITQCIYDVYVQSTKELVKTCNSSYMCMEVNMELDTNRDVHFACWPVWGYLATSTVMGPCTHNLQSICWQPCSYTPNRLAEKRVRTLTFALYHHSVTKSTFTLNSDDTWSNHYPQTQHCLFN